MPHPNRPLLARAAFVAFTTLGLCSFSSGVDEAGKGEHPAAGSTSAGVWTPPLKPASDAGEKAIARIKVAPDLKVSLWAAEPMMGDPNAISVDEKGRVYVAETYRYHGGVHRHPRGDELAGGRPRLQDRGRPRRDDQTAR